jgi:hypothetical protein
MYHGGGDVVVSSRRMVVWGTEKLVVDLMSGLVGVLMERSWLMKR